MILGTSIKTGAIENYGSEAQQRQPIAVEVAKLAASIANHAQQVSEIANIKLQPVMTSETPRACNGQAKDSVEYPPLFSDLRNSLQGIESALNSIEYMLSRTEL